MKPLQAIKKYFQAQVRKAFDPLENIDLNKVVGWRTIGGSSVYGYYQDNQYENGYSSISKLANGFAQCEPYTIDKNGKSVPSNVLDRLYTPNTDMSAYDFREALAVTSLVHDKVRLRVHHRGTRINAESIQGFTFMEDYTESIIGGKRQYRLSNGDTLTDDEVITLKSVNPESITDGFSPSRAARRWTRLDDFIADYQKGFFENGAVPSGQMIITAKTTTEFNDIVDMMQARHKGAGKSNNITYTHRPTNQNGEPLNSQIEWVPFASPNKDMGLKDLFDNVNKKIDSVYGVPASIRGVNDQNTYASVRVDEVIFVKYALNPMTLKIWSKFTHELNRITGGTGVAIDYDLDIPQIADEEKVKAEAKNIDATTVTSLIAQGFTLESIVEYINTGELYTLVIGEAPQKEEVEVLSPEEARGTPDQPIDIYSKQIKDELADIKSMLKVEVKEKQLSEIDKELYEFHLMRIIRSQMTRQVDRAISKLDQAIKSKAFGDTTEEEDTQFTAEMLALMTPLMALQANRTVNTGINLIVQAGLSTQNIKRFEFTPAQRKEYERYLAKIGTGYAEQTAEQIRTVLGQSILDGATKAEIEAQLRQVILGAENEYRVARLARTEINLSEGRASIYAMDNIMEQTGYSIYKVWHTSGANPCPFCEELDGTETLVDQSFLSLGESISVGDAVFNNDWTDVDSASLHANCNCYTTFRVERG